jgi:type I restriction enzyme R subunit
VSDFLKESGDRFQKTIVFCVDEEHAARMRQALINENQDLCGENYRYVMRITGSDTEGQAQLGNFIDPEARYPVVVTTSRLLSTGVDVQTCRLIALDRAIGSMTEFKQIVGRGTRVHEDTRKFYFTIIDFRGATSHFADREFDGEPVQIYEPGDDDAITPPDDVPPPEDDEEPIPPEPNEDETIVDGEPPDIAIQAGGGRRRKIYVDGVSAAIIAERVEYLDEHGRLVTESLRDFTRKALKKRFASLDDFLKCWKTAERKQAIIDELESEGLLLDPLAEEVGKDLDPFDLICHVAFDRPPLSRRERGERPQARRLHEVRRTGACGARRSPRQIPGRGGARSGKSAGSAHLPVRSDGHAHPAHRALRFARRFRACCPRPSVRALRGSRLSHVCPHHCQIDSGHYAQGYRRRR